MHTLKIPDNISEPVPVRAGQSLEAGKTYLCSNAFVGQFLLTRWRVVINGEMYPLRTLVKAEPWSHGVSVELNGNWNGRDIWLVRGGGWGDLLMLTPLIRELKKRWPTIKIHISCGNEHHCLFHGMDVITEQAPMVWDTEDPNGPASTVVVTFEDLVEGDPASEKVHMAQLFASKMNIELDDLTPMYNLTPREKDFAEREFPKNGLRRIGVQFLASALYRSYPKVQKVITDLADNGCEVFIFGTPGQMKLVNPIKNVTNLMERGFDFRESAAVLSTCDACIAPDSSLVHLCSALDIPCVALYGPFPSALRVTSPKCHPIDGKAPCAPCFFHATHSTEFPANMPCSEIHRCVAMEDIPVDKIVKSAMELATPVSSIIVQADFSKS